MLWHNQVLAKLKLLLLYFFGLLKAISDYGETDCFFPLMEMELSPLYMYL